MIDPKQIARMISEDPDEVPDFSHFDDTEDEYIGGYPCPECGDNLDEVEGASCCYGIDSKPLKMTCTNHICWSCLYLSGHDTGMSATGWFIDQGRGEYYCPDHAAEAQTRNATDAT